MHSPYGSVLWLGYTEVNAPYGSVLWLGYLKVHVYLPSPSQYVLDLVYMNLVSPRHLDWDH